MELHSDQRSNFESKLANAMMVNLGIHKTRTTPLHPESDGMVQRFKHTIVQAISKFLAEKQQDWEKRVPLCLRAYRAPVHETTQ